MLETNQSPLSKEAIASRMFRHAARYWGLNDTNMDNFDPLVRLLIEACAVEVYRIGNEIAAVQERMTQKLAGLLTPEVYVQAKPSSAVLHARCLDEQCFLPAATQLVAQKKVSSRANGPLDTNLDVFFGPTGRFKTVDGDVKLIAAGTNVYTVNEWQQKETWLKTSPGKAFPYRTAWVGIELRQPVDLTGLPVFFDLKNTPAKDRYLSLLQYTQCAINGREVVFTKGLPETEEALPGNEDSLEVLYINRRMARSVNNTYRHHFLTVGPDNEELKEPDGSLFRPYPPEFAQYLGARELAMMADNLLWVQFTFTPEFSPELLDDLTVSINCFPVANRRLNHITYRLNSFFNIIPLLSSEQFFSIQSVEGTAAGGSGRTSYVFYPFDHFDPNGKGSYTIRSGDLQRFDNRNAAEYLNYLVELLRDESRAFAAFGQDFIATTIKELNQNINLIEQKLIQNKVLLQHAPTYLLINPIEEGDTIFVSFWTSNGEMANGIRSGSRLDLYEGADLRRDSLVLMTTTTGGRDRLKNTEVLAAYKSALLSRDRIVTEMDIRNFCAYFLQDKCGPVSVSRGIGVSPRPQEGLVPVVNVDITLAEGVELDAEESEGICRELLAELERQSVVDMNYKVSLTAQE